MPEDGPEYGAWRLALGIVAAGLLIGLVCICAGVLLVWTIEAAWSAVT
jgi:hypothetical protein